jgi:hypothetical protein
VSRLHGRSAHVTVELSNGRRFEFDSPEYSLNLEAERINITDIGARSLSWGSSGYVHGTFDFTMMSPDALVETTDGRSELLDNYLKLIGAMPE